MKMLLADSVPSGRGSGLNPEPSGTVRPDYVEERLRMAKYQLECRGRDIRNPRVVAALRSVPRHLFVPEELRPMAYEDRPLPIGHGQTISQPFVVAFMTEALDPKPTDRVLEIGTGSGYQAAVLSLLVEEVCSFEIVEPLGRQARETLKQLGYTNVRVAIGDGYRGCREDAPFDAIIVTCAPNHVPPPLVEQLKEGGRLIVPIGVSPDQALHLLKKRDGRVREQALLPVRFVPMTGEAVRPAG
jgi:protein-L-isoaspartate(D-aspartate) O-methyltransferase